MRRTTAITGSQISVYVGREDMEGYAVKAEFLLSHIEGAPEKSITKRYSRARKGRPSQRVAASKGAFRANGTITCEVTLDGGFPILLTSRLAYQTTTGAGPAYTHNLANLFGTTANPNSTDTFTLFVMDPKYITVYAGCSIGNMSFSVGDSEGSQVVQAESEIFAINVYSVPNTAAKRTAWGIDTAASGTLKPLIPEEALVTFNGKSICINEFSLTLNRTMESKPCRNGKNGVEGYIEGTSETSFQATGYYRHDESMYRSSGYASLPSGTWSDTALLLTDVVTIEFEQQASGGVTPKLTFTLPQADTSVTNPTPLEGIITQTLTCQPLDDAGGDVRATLINGMTNTAFRRTMDAVAFAEIPPSQWTWNWGGTVQTIGGGVAVVPTANVYHTTGQEAVPTPGIRQAPVVANQFAGNYKLFALSGAAKGTSQTILSNGASNTPITLTATLAGLAVGDIFAIVDA